jgi:hypothetical protein
MKAKPTLLTSDIRRTMNSPTSVKPLRRDERLYAVPVRHPQATCMVCSGVSRRSYETICCDYWTRVDYGVMSWSSGRNENWISRSSADTVTHCNLRSFRQNHRHFEKCTESNIHDSSWRNYKFAPTEIAVLCSRCLWSAEKQSLVHNELTVVTK